MILRKLSEMFKQDGDKELQSIIAQVKKEEAKPAKKVSAYVKAAKLYQCGR